MSKLESYIVYLRTKNPVKENGPASYVPEAIKTSAIAENKEHFFTDINEFFQFLVQDDQAPDILQKLQQTTLPASSVTEEIYALKKELISKIPAYTENMVDAAEIINEIDSRFSTFTGAIIKKLTEEKKQAETTYQEKEQSHFRFLDELALAIFAIDAEGRPFYANKCAGRILGKGIAPDADKEELSGLYNAYIRGSNNIYPNTETPIIKALNGESTYIDNMEIHRPEGNIPLEVWGSPIFDKNAKVIYAIAVFNDISKRKRLEDEIIKKEVFLDSIIENIPNMLFVKDAEELRFVRFNKAGEELLGYPKKEMIGKNDYDFFPKEQADFFTAKDRDVLESGKMLDIPEELIQTKKKGERILHTKKIPITDESGKPLYLLGISEDITEKKKAADALEQRTRELARSNTDLEQFAYVASHDLQEPLRTVSSYVQLIERRYEDKLDNDAKEFIKFAVDGVNRMQNLISALLQYSRVSTRGQEPVPTNIEDVINAVKQNLHEAIVESKATITADELPTLKADEAQMIQLFQNLIGNALKFKGEADPKIHISAKKQDSFWLFSVKDNGIGIEKENLERIFIIFQRLHTRDEYKGTGIGLAVCKKIVERHGGKIWAESEEGKGTTFFFTIKDAK